MTVIILLPFLKLSELTRFCQLNKECCRIIKEIVNFQILFQTWGVNLPPVQAWAIKQESKTLETAAKYLMINSVRKSKRIIPKRLIKYVYGTVTVPNIPTLGVKNFEKLRNLTIEKVQWEDIFTLGFTLNDGQSCKVGNHYDFKLSHTFDPNKKITRIEVWINKIETWVYQTNRGESQHSEFSEKLIKNALLFAKII